MFYNKIINHTIFSSGKMIFYNGEPEDYNGLRRLHILSSKIWRPDIVLYNRLVVL